MRPKIVPQNIKFWRELYCRFERGAHPREPLLDLLAITQNHTTSLEGKPDMTGGSKSISFEIEYIKNTQLFYFSSVREFLLYEISIFQIMVDNLRKQSISIPKRSVRQNQHLRC